jgi:hypothetical protein
MAGKVVAMAREVVAMAREHVHKYEYPIKIVIFA